MRIFNIVVLGSEHDGLEPFVAAMNACQDGVGPLIIMSGNNVDETLSHLETATRAYGNCSGLLVSHSFSVPSRLENEKLSTTLRETHPNVPIVCWGLVRRGGVRGKHYHFGLDWSRADGAGLHLHPTKPSVVRTLRMLKCGEIKAGFNFQRPDEDRVDLVGALSLPVFPFMVNSRERETGDDMLRWKTLVADIKRDIEANPLPAARPKPRSLGDTISQRFSESARFFFANESERTREVMIRALREAAKRKARAAGQHHPSQSNNSNRGGAAGALHSSTGTTTDRMDSFLSDATTAAALEAGRFAGHHHGHGGVRATPGQHPASAEDFDDAWSSCDSEFSIVDSLAGLESLLAAMDEEEAMRYPVVPPSSGSSGGGHATEVSSSLRTLISGPEVSTGGCIVVGHPSSAVNTSNKVVSVWTAHDSPTQDGGACMQRWQSMPHSLGASVHYAIPHMPMQDANPITDPASVTPESSNILLGLGASVPPRVSSAVMAPALPIPEAAVSPSSPLISRGDTMHSSSHNQVLPLTTDNISVTRGISFGVKSSISRSADMLISASDEVSAGYGSCDSSVFQHVAHNQPNKSCAHVGVHPSDTAAAPKSETSARLSTMPSQGCTQVSPNVSSAEAVEKGTSQTGPVSVILRSSSTVTKSAAAAATTKAELSAMLKSAAAELKDLRRLVEEKKRMDALPEGPSTLPDRALTSQ
ncbi:hypothetical protein CEUSTIGMA_g3917.t1 [Chlamydomonas eustigma]|uniref:Uncharacterized protein n=1 Tax=Chlamydomonas eustigma TaxID=1157962 RepID=A0A250X0P9_9CHLO|nr:hypothetical protein CEUSTIGMA_g3917.t1 [Chlamydomonas eustigma]|eukprot:GAX76472.1 hypothetical protein CEUSTIGMA_g3917.t1 [Chlamydomonas eustigma]